MSAVQRKQQPDSREPEDLNAQANAWFRDLPKPLGDFTLAELREMAWDATSPFHRGPFAKALQSAYTHLVAAQPPVEKSTPMIMASALKHYVGKNERWHVVVENVPPERLTDPAFYSVVASKLHAYDTIEIVDSVRREWTEILVAGYPGNLVYTVLRKVELPLSPDRGDQSDVPPNHRITYDEATARWVATRNHDGAVIVSNAMSRKECLRALQDHASLRGDRTPVYTTAQ